MSAFNTRALLLFWSLGRAATFALNVIDTWHGHASILVKVLINLTLDAFLASIWPITWMLWLVEYAMGKSTPFDFLF